jgi:hypothetical protein
MGAGLYLKYLSTGEVERTDWDDPLGGMGETFSHGEMVVGVSGGAEVISNVALGGAVKYARQDLDDLTGHGMFADIGVTLRLHPWQWTTDPGLEGYASFVTRNITMVRWGNTEGDPPFNSEVGLGIDSPNRRVRGGLSFCLARAGHREVRFGLTAGPSDEFEVRIGYRRRTGVMSDHSNDMPWERGLSAGFGVAFDRVWLDYTYEDASPLDGIHRFGLQARLGSDSD